MRRHGDDALREGVLLLHGIARTPSSMRKMERALAAEGFDTLNLGYPARRYPLEALADIVAPDVASFMARVERLHLVTHSMGGLLARACIRRRRPGNLGRVVMLAPPNGGSEMADRMRDFAPYRRFFGPAGAQLGTRQDPALRSLLGEIDFPLGIIAGDRSLVPFESLFMLPRPHDGRVTVERTRVAGLADHVTLHATHATMMWNRRVIEETLHFLRNGRFGAPPRG